MTKELLLKELMHCRKAFTRPQTTGWKVELLQPTADDPFNKIQLDIVDIGWSDKILVVEMPKETKHEAR